MSQYIPAKLVVAMKIVNQLVKSRIVGVFPREMKDRARRILTGIGLYDERPRRLGLEAVYDDDIFIVSYPKSGNTWVRFLLANMMCSEEVVNFRNIESYVADIYKSPHKINTMRRPRFIKSHHPLFECYPRVVYIFRDGRDVMVSYYHYLIDLGRFSGTFDEFLSDSLCNSFGGWENHVIAAINHAASNPQRVLLLRYEDMLLDTMAHAKQIARFCRLSVTDEVIRKAVDSCKFNRLQETEREFGPEYEGGKEFQFFRRGTSGQWQEYFSEESLAKFYARAGDALHKLRYLSAHT